MAEPIIKLDEVRKVFLTDDVETRAADTSLRCRVAIEVERVRV